MAMEIVSFPMNSMVDLSSSLCKRLPEGNAMSNYQGLMINDGYPYIKVIQGLIIKGHNFNHCIQGLWVMMASHPLMYLFNDANDVNHVNVGLYVICIYVYGQ